MKKRLFKCGLAMAALVLLGFLAPSIYWQIAGRWRGEAFYAGRPTSYWRERILRDQEEPARRAVNHWNGGTWGEYLDQMRVNLLGGDVTAVAALATSSDSILVLRELLTDDDINVRSEAFCIAQQDDERANALLREMVHHVVLSPNEVSRVGTIFVASKAFSTGAAPHYCNYLRERDELRASNAIWALGRIGADAIPELNKLLVSEHAETRLNAMRTLVAMNGAPEERICVFLKYSNDSDQRVRSAAADGLKRAQEQLNPLRQACPTPLSTNF